MTKAITMMQPGLFPWWGTFEKIALCDVVVHLDHLSWQKGGFLNRFVLRNNQRMLWCTLPKDRISAGMPISEVTVSPPSGHLLSHRTKLNQMCPRAPFIHEAEALMEKIYRVDTRDAADVAIRSIQEVCARLQLSAEHVRSSGLDVKYAKTKMILGIAHDLGCDTYVFGPGRCGLSAHYLDVPMLITAGMNVEVAEYRPAPRVSILQDVAAAGLVASKLLAPKVAAVNIHGRRH